MGKKNTEASFSYLQQGNKVTMVKITFLYCFPIWSTNIVTLTDQSPKVAMCWYGFHIAIVEGRRPVFETLGVCAYTTLTLLKSSMKSWLLLCGTMCLMELWAESLQVEASTTQLWYDRSPQWPRPFRIYTDVGHTEVWMITDQAGICDLLGVRPV